MKTIRNICYILITIQSFFIIHYIIELFNGRTSAIFWILINIIFGSINVLNILTCNKHINDN